MAPPGRLGDPQMSLATDPRTNPRLLAALTAHGMHNNISLPHPITSSADAISFARTSEHSLESLISTLNFSTPHADSSVPITQTNLSIPGLDGNHIRLIIYRPTHTPPASPDPLPAILYFHGGAMAILNTFSPLHTSYASSLAQLGFVCVLVDFRNVVGPPSAPLNPFPAGLNDCVAAVRYIHAQRTALRLAKIVLHGDSGGGNLALATALQLAEAPHTRAMVDGVCVVDPFISGAYGFAREWRRAHLPSLVECDGYDVSCEGSAVLARLYAPLDHHHHHPPPPPSPPSLPPPRFPPLAWPYWASPAAMRALPPHFILTAELDPLRDEGTAYLRKLLRAGVPAQGRVRKGMTHCGELLLRGSVPEEFERLLLDVRRWVVGSL